MFITFEGIEGCGKTTQIKRLENGLRRKNIPLMRTLEPGGTTIGHTIRRILLDSNHKNLSPLAELILYEADRAQHVEEVIKPALDKGQWVLCDRFCDATVAYQGFARGMDMVLIRTLNDAVTRGIRPDLTFLLDCPVEIGLERARTRNRDHAQKGQDRFEQERLAFHRVVRRGYLELASKEDKRFVIIDAALTEDRVEEEIFRVLTPYLVNNHYDI
ncbi:MAG: dTMP kinase [Deltaproteobacteria bacterium]|nr:dTMP kinase [Deltaproteobacteria bacterium]